MGFLFFILLVAAGGLFVWLLYLYSALARSEILITYYLRTVFLLMDETSINNEGLRKQLLRIYLFDHSEVPTTEFNQPWEILSKAWDVKPNYKALGSYGDIIDKTTVDIIAKAMYENRIAYSEIINKIPRRLNTQDLESNLS